MVVSFSNYTFFVPKILKPLHMHEKEVETVPALDSMKILATDSLESDLVLSHESHTPDTVGNQKLVEPSSVKLDTDVLLDSLFSQLSNLLTPHLTTSSFQSYNNIMQDIRSHAPLHHKLNTIDIPANFSKDPLYFENVVIPKLENTEKYLSEETTTLNPPTLSLEDMYKCDDSWIDNDPQLAASDKARYHLGAPSGLERPISALLHLLNRTCEHGENTAALLLGLRGEGKSTALRWVLSEIYSKELKHPSNPSGVASLPFILVTLSGAQLTDDKKAITEAVSQVCTQLRILNPLPPEATFLENAKFLAMISTKASHEGLVAQSQAPTSSTAAASFPSLPSNTALTSSTLETTSAVPAASQPSTSSPAARGLPFIFVLDEFQEFARRGTSAPGSGSVGKQPLLYFLCDMLQGSFCRTSVIALTSMISAYDLLEKRIRSRLPFRTILFPHTLTSEKQVDEFVTSFFTPSVVAVSNSLFKDHRAQWISQPHSYLEPDDNDETTVTKSIQAAHEEDISRILHLSNYKVALSPLTICLLLSARASLQDKNLRTHLISFCICSGHSAQWFASLSLLALLVAVRCRYPNPRSLLESLLPYIKEMADVNAAASGTKSKRRGSDKNSGKYTSTASSSTQSRDRSLQLGYASGSASPFRVNMSLTSLSAHHASAITPGQKMYWSEKQKELEKEREQKSGNSEKKLERRGRKRHAAPAPEVLRSIVRSAPFSYAVRMFDIPFIHSSSSSTQMDDKYLTNQIDESSQSSHGPVSALSTPVLKKKKLYHSQPSTPLRTTVTSFKIPSNLPQTPSLARQLSTPSTPSFHRLSFGAPGTPSTPQRSPAGSSIQNTFTIGTSGEQRLLQQAHAAPLLIGPEDYWAAYAILTGHPRWMQIRSLALKSRQIPDIETNKTNSKTDKMKDDKYKSVSLVGKEPLEPPSITTSLLQDLSVLELALVASMLQLERKGVIPYTFEIIYFEYAQYMAKPSNQIGVSNSAHFAFPKPVCFQAFQTLLDLGIVVFVYKPVDRAVQGAVAGISGANPSTMIQRLFETNKDEKVKEKRTAPSEVDHSSATASLFISEIGDENAFGVTENVEESVSIVRAQGSATRGTTPYDTIRLSLDPRECKDFLSKEGNLAIPTWLTHWVQSQTSSYAH